MIAAMKLKPYFQAHFIIMHMKAPIRQLLHNSGVAGRTM